MEEWDTRPKGMVGFGVFEWIEILKILKKTWWGAQAMNIDKTS